MKTKASPLLKTNRESNFELYRIILMLLIVMHHYVVNSGLIDQGGPIYADLSAKRSMVLLLLGAWGKSAVNGFLLITGYFMCKKNITAKKYAMLLCETMFYRIVIMGVFFITGVMPVTRDNLLSMLLPVRFLTNIYTRVYLVFFLAIPFINHLIKNLSEKKHLLLIMFAFYVYVLFGNFAKLKLTMNYFSWFVVMYIVGAYFGRFERKIFNRRSLWCILMAGSMFISAATIIDGLNKGKIVYMYVSEVNRILAVSNGLTSFLVFKNIRMRKNRFINLVAGSVYGVLLIHTCNAAMVQWLWKDTLQVTRAFNASAPMLLLNVIIGVIGVFAVCTVIDILRKLLLEKPVFSLWDRFFPRVKKHLVSFDGMLCKRLHIGTEIQ